MLMGACCCVYFRGDAGKWRQPQYSRGIRQKYFRWEEGVWLQTDAGVCHQCQYRICVDVQAGS